VSAWRWLWAWFGEPERPPRRRQATGPIGDAMPGRGEMAGGRAERARAGPSRRSRRPLPRATRAELERTLGADLADLSLTIDPGFTAALDARAVQLGSTIVLGEPADAQALPLLAHEAMHALQARRRGTRPGIGAPGDASEQAAARAGDALASGRPMPPAASGPPVAAIQRQPAAPGETRGAGERDPEAIRAMLMLAYAKQGGHGDFTWSDELAAAFRRLLPGVTLARLQLLWEPPPKGPAEALARLQAAGIVMATALPTPLEPAAPPAPAPEVAEAPSEPMAPEPLPEPRPPKVVKELLPPEAVAKAPPEMPAPTPEPLEQVVPAEEAELQPRVEEPVPVSGPEEVKKGLDVTLVVTLPKRLPEAFAERTRRSARAFASTAVRSARCGPTAARPGRSTTSSSRARPSIPTRGRASRSSLPTSPGSPRSRRKALPMRCRRQPPARLGARRPAAFSPRARSPIFSRPLPIVRR
jgi:hypothetical protein